jgi:hypothetical protein
MHTQQRAKHCRRDAVCDISTAIIEQLSCLPWRELTRPPTPLKTQAFRADGKRRLSPYQRCDVESWDGVRWARYDMSWKNYEIS